MIRTTISRMFSLVAALAVVLTLGGCLHDKYDVEYKYDVPQATECPSGMQHRSGGTGIVDRSGGTGIVDRNSNPVTDYCYKPNCPGAYDDTIPPTMKWHQDAHRKVVAERTCVALPAPPPPSGGTPSSSPDSGGAGTPDQGSDSSGQPE